MFRAESLKLLAKREHGPLLDLPATGGDRLPSNVETGEHRSQEPDFVDIPRHGQTVAVASFTPTVGDKVGEQTILPPCDTGDVAFGTFVGINRNAKQRESGCGHDCEPGVAFSPFFTDQCQGAALVPAADPVAWRFQTPGSAL
jgi:hypothetical protein